MENRTILKLVFLAVCLSLGNATPDWQQYDRKMDAILETLGSLNEQFAKSTEHLESRIDMLDWKLGGESIDRSARMDDVVPAGITERIDSTTQDIKTLATTIADHVLQVKTDIEALKTNLNMEVSKVLEAVQENAAAIVVVNTLTAAVQTAVDDLDSDLVATETNIIDAIAGLPNEEEANQILSIIEKLDSSLAMQDTIKDTLMQTKTELSGEIDSSEQEVIKQVDSLRPSVDLLPPIQERAHFIARGVEYLSKKLYTTSNDITYILNALHPSHYGREAVPEEE